MIMNSVKEAEKSEDESTVDKGGSNRKLTKVVITILVPVWIQLLENSLWENCFLRIDFE